MPVVQFQTFTSLVQPEFWHELTRRKVDELRLSQDALPIHAGYALARTAHDRESGADIALPANFVLGADAFGDPPARDFRQGVVARGSFRNVNTMEEFKALDKAAIFAAAIDEMWTNALEQDDPNELTRFLVICFADLKKYKYVYWFGFPTFTAKPAWEIDERGWTSASDAVDAGVAVFMSRGRGLDGALRTARPFFLTPNCVFTQGAESGPPLVRKPARAALCSKGRVAGGVAVAPAAQAPGPQRRTLRLSPRLQALWKALSDKSFNEPYFIAKPNGEVALLKEYDAFFAGVPENERIVAFLDPCASENPGWPLRNLLAYLRHRHPTQPSFRILSFRDAAPGTWKSRVGTLAAAPAWAPSAKSTTGWEKSAAGKLMPRVADLAPSMDPHRLAAQAVDLNLKLMRWRLLPQLDLDRIAGMRCLLLGAGTLGCYVARGLLAWGVRNITLLDSGRVSFSNPVRQPLFEFNDCVDGGKPKAEAAAEALKRIFPGVNARGVTLSIPIPGHSVAPGAEEERVRKDVQTLDALFDAHDAVFLLMDSRESRWLPTLLGVQKGKVDVISICTLT
ncbi:hypothetical protein AURDEDRAFT_183978 [Auricularia subglabra TFB-10046 SS5]|nr:hypothetical protein AURDEDRAFT_183978 [Auricularia subglabra TFB-10046 SS5]